VIDRLARIERLIVGVTVFAAVATAAAGVCRAGGVLLGGTAALVDFVLIRRLASLAIGRRRVPVRLVPMALAKSAVLLIAPAAALLLPPWIVDGVSFAVGVTALPMAIVLDALLPSARVHVRGAW
jgi:hypothetical protein